MNLENKYVSLISNWDLEDYKADTPNQNMLIIRELLNCDFSGTDVLTIRSQQGCGGSHLLYGIANELIDRGDNLCCISAERLLDYAEGIERKQFLNYLKTCSFFLLDDIDLIIFRTDTIKSNWLKVILNNFISSGGKVVCSHTEPDFGHKEFKQYLGDYNILEVILTFPSFDTLEAIAGQHVPEDIINKYSKKVYRKSSCTREYLNGMITCKARTDLKLNIEI